MTLEMTCIQKLTSNTGLSCVSVVLLNFPVFTSSHIDVPVWHAVDSFAPFCLPACLVHRACQSLQAYNILQGNCAQFSTTIFGRDGEGGWGACPHRTSMCCQLVRSWLAALQCQGWKGVLHLDCIVVNLDLCWMMTAKPPMAKTESLFCDECR